jgi:hypothetical protein
MFPGSGNWIIPEDLWFARESFGLAKSVLSVELLARAAKLRVAVMGCRFDGGSDTIKRLRRLGSDNIYARWSQLQRDLSQTDYFYRAALWAGWYGHSYCKVLVDIMQWLESKGVT